MILGLASDNSQNNGVAKVDYHLNDKNTLSGMYFNGRGGGIWNDGAYQVGIPGSNNSPWMSDLFGFIQMGYGAWTWTPKSNWVNELRVGYDRYNQSYLSADSTVNPLDLRDQYWRNGPQLFRLSVYSLLKFQHAPGRQLAQAARSGRQLADSGPSIVAAWESRHQVWR